MGYKMKELRWTFVKTPYKSLQHGTRLWADKDCCVFTSLNVISNERTNMTFTFHLVLMRTFGMSVSLSACLPFHLCCSHRYRTDPGHRITKRSLWGTFRWSTEHGHYYI